MATDFLLDDTSDLLIQGNDFVIGESTLQEVKHIIETAPGQFRESPTIGVLADHYLNSPDPERNGLLNEVQRQLKFNGIRTKSLAIQDNGDIKLELR